jgi:hypothetical protein
MNMQHLTPEQQAAIRELNHLAKRLAAVPHPERSPASSKAGLAKVMAAGRPRKHKTGRWRLLAITVSALACLALIILFAGTALPGGKLYALKRTTENVRNSFTFSTIGKANNCGKLMSIRADELAKLAKKDKRVEEKIVANLTQDILLNAKEYQDYIAKLPSDQQATAKTERQSAAAVVVTKLVKIDKSDIPDSSQQTVLDTITTLRTIAEG